jgi:hypothetical protein
VPAGYGRPTVRAAIMLPPGYPNAPLDMVYFHPSLSRADNRPIAALADHSIEGVTWQRWSRHYPWRAGVDDLVTHIERIGSWLADELRR